MADLSAESLARTLIQLDLPAWLDETFLYTLYSGTGQLVSAKVARSAAGTSEGYAYIEFASAETADGVLRGYNGHPIPNTEQVFKLTWASAGRSVLDTGGPDHSVFVGDLAPDVSDYVLTDKFRQYFPSVRSAKVITDPVTGRSKGYGFVRFGSEPERDRALGEMAGHLISNRPIRVSVATAKKNTSTVGAVSSISEAAVSATDPHPSDYDPTNTTLFIGGLSAAVAEEELQAQFGRFGDIIYVKIPPGKGCGFVQYVHRSVAEVAMTTMQGQNIGGSSIRISWGRSSSRSAPAVAAAASSSYSAYGGAPSAYGGAYGADPYAAYGAAAAAAANPYAAAYPAYSQAPDYSAYQAYQAPAAAAPAAAAPATPLSNGHSYAAYGSYGAAAPAASPAPAPAAAAATAGAKADLRDPLAGLDIHKLNAEYIQRHQAALLGNLLG